MTKIDIFSGFLGAGKTTLIKKLIAEAYAGQKLVLIENEFGEIGIDGGFLKEAGVEITEMNSGCICCSLVGDFRKALLQVIDQYQPDRIVIEPSGVGKLSDVTKAVQAIAQERDVQLNSFVTVADVNKVKMYMKNFGEFYNDQISHASAVILSRTGGCSEEKVARAVEQIRSKNPDALIITTDWDQLSGEQIVEAMEGQKDLVAELVQQAAEAQHGHHHHHEHGEECGCGGHHHHHEHGEECGCGGHHHHHEHGEECGCGGHHHHHEHGEECGCGGHHHHHEHGEECGCGGHHHHHEHGEECGCGGHHHHHEHGEECGCGGHHHHHHAEDVFTSWGRQTAHRYTDEAIHQALEALDTGRYGTVLRAKGIVEGNGQWIYFDYVPGEADVRHGSAQVTGRLCVIGAQLDEQALQTLFGLG